VERPSKAISNESFRHVVGVVATADLHLLRPFRQRYTADTICLDHSGQFVAGRQTTRPSRSIVPDADPAIGDRRDPSQPVSLALVVEARAVKDAEEADRPKPTRFLTG